MPQAARLHPQPPIPVPTHTVHSPPLWQLRCYRLLDFFSFLTYSLAYPLLFVTLLRNVLVGGASLREVAGAADVRTNAAGQWVLLNAHGCHILPHPTPIPQLHVRFACAR